MEQSSGNTESSNPPHDLQAVIQCLSTDDAKKSGELMALQITIEACLGMCDHMACIMYVCVCVCICGWAGVKYNHDLPHPPPAHFPQTSHTLQISTTPTCNRSCQMSVAYKSITIQMVCVCGNMSLIECTFGFYVPIFIQKVQPYNK